ncbi:nitroreductase/quinone reductase family protein [Pseudonocardia spirodelae]|uniref:Nitroreductase/quinone reductase family protein n=1 Tax=Pseudonocardia spirodelae TaxID=3133431 RepID=A0ABU8T328_9PSEU
MSRDYRAPGPLVRRVLNPLVGALARRGLAPGDTAVLAVRGRRSGTLHTTPLTPVEVDGTRHLISPRGETDWVRNLRAAGGAAELRSGGRTEPVAATELDTAAAVPVLRAYLDGLGRAAAVLFDDVAPGASDAELAAAAPRHPVFALA